MKILDVLNQLEELIEDSTKVPLTGKVLVDDEVIFDLIDRIRTALPEEIRQAKWINNERDKILDEARKDAGRYVEEAKKEISKLADETEVVQQAKERGQEIVDQARQVAKEIKEGAMDYAHNLLQGLKGSLEKSLSHVEQGLDELKVTDKKTEEKPKEA